jgi:hypothetical protein
MLSTTTPNGHLTFCLEPEDTDQIEVMMERHGGDDIGFLGDMLDYFGFTPNGRLFSINPEDVGALTSAPMLSDDVEYDDTGKPSVRGKVWWYPRYESTNFAEELARTGQVTFTKGH